MIIIDMQFQFGDKPAVSLEADSIFIHRLGCCDSVIFCHMAIRVLHKILEALHKLTYTMISNLLIIDY